MSILYAFQGFVGSFTSPVANPSFFQITGSTTGITKFSIQMDGEVTKHERAASGNVVISAIVIKNGTFGIETYQNSAEDAYLIGWYNTLTSLRDQHDVSNWATTTMSFADTASGRVFTFSGVSPKKLPDRTYGVDAATVTWDLMAAFISQE